MIFISYSRKDEALVVPVVKLLRASGHKVFIDIQDLEYGRDWKIQLTDAICESDRFLLFWSASSKASTFVQEEWELALANPKCMIVPIMIDRTPLPRELEHYHGLSDLVPIFQKIISAKKQEQWLKISWLTIAGILTLFTGGLILLLEPPTLVLSLGTVTAEPTEWLTEGTFTFIVIGIIFLLGIIYIGWLMFFSLPIGIFLAFSWYRSQFLYRRLISKIG